MPFHRLENCNRVVGYGFEPFAAWKNTLLLSSNHSPAIKNHFLFRRTVRRLEKCPFTLVEPFASNKKPFFCSVEPFASEKKYCLSGNANTTAGDYPSPPFAGRTSGPLQSIQKKHYLCHPKSGK